MTATSTSLLFRMPAPVASPVTVAPVRPEHAPTLLRLARAHARAAGEGDAAWTDLLEFHEALFEAPLRAWAWLAWAGEDAIGHAVATVGFSLRARGYCLQIDVLHARREWAHVAEAALFEEVRAMGRRLGCVQLHWHGGDHAAPSFDAHGARRDDVRHVLALA